MNTRVRNTLGGRSGGKMSSVFMKPLVLITLVLVGLFSFGALITLSGFADEFQDGNNGRAHALSRSAIGYGGLVKLLGEQDFDVNLKSNPEPLSGESNTLRVITLSYPVSDETLPDMDLEIPTLIVMPKWLTTPMREKRGWVDRLPANFDQVYGIDNYNRGFADVLDDIKFDQGGSSKTSYNLSGDSEGWPYLQNAAIDTLQSVAGDSLVPLVRAGRKTILARVEDRALYILSEPDILNTYGISEHERARFASDMIGSLLRDEFLNEDRIIFDLSLHGFGSKNNLIKVMLRPPFLTATLCLLAAGLLIGWQAFSRFGDPKKPVRDYALGKFTLADNAARFIKIAERESRMAPGYIDLIRRRTAKDMYIQKHAESDIDSILTRRSETLEFSDSWDTIKSDMEKANDTDALLRSAKKLYHWRQEITHDSQ